jgi:uncharacterized repeat protein (TIGR01451 family)
MNYTNDIGIWQGEVGNNTSSTVFTPEIKPSKMVDKAQAYPGDSLNYTLYFNNTGNDVAYNVTIDDILPQNVTYLNDNSGTVGCASNTANLPLVQFNCTWLNPGQNSITIEVMVNVGLSDGVMLNNLMIVDYQTWMGVPLQTEIDSAQTVVNTGRFSLSKVADRQMVGPGGLINYTVYYNNTGSAPAAFGWLNDTLPNDVTFISSSKPPTTVNGQDRTSFADHQRIRGDPERHLAEQHRDLRVYRPERQLYRNANFKSRYHFLLQSYVHPFEDPGKAPGLEERDVQLHHPIRQHR